MLNAVSVIEEEPSHHVAIRAIIADAFGRNDEARLVDDLRRAGDLAVSLVAYEAGEACGHVALSRLKSPACGLALAPVAVLTAKQRRGIGAALVRRANERARELGYALVLVLGEPAYYTRFGFSAKEAARFTCRYAGPHFMALSLSEHKVAPAPVIYPDAFARLE